MDGEGRGVSGGVGPWEFVWNVSAAKFSGSSSGPRTSGRISSPIAWRAAGKLWFWWEQTGRKISVCSYVWMVKRASAANFVGDGCDVQGSLVVKRRERALAWFSRSVFASGFLVGCLRYRFLRCLHLDYILSLRSYQESGG